MCASGKATYAKASRHHLGDIGVGQRQTTSAKVCTHMTWHVRIEQATSANGRQHQPRPARISRGVCASAGRHLRRQRQATSANFYMHLTWPARFGQATSANGKRHRPGDIGRGLPALPRPVQIVEPTSAVDCLHRPWPVHIDHSSSGVAFLHLPWPANIGQPTSGVACPHLSWPAHIAFGLHTTVSQRRT